MHESLYLVLGYAISVVSIIAYSVQRFSKLENDVVHLRKDIDEFHEVKQIVYEIRAQNNIMLQMKVSKDSLQ